MIRKVVQVIFWMVIIFIINVLGRYLCIELFVGYHYMYAIYIILVGFYATLIAIILFFAVNYKIAKKRKEQILFSFTKTRFFIMLASISIAIILDIIWILNP